MLGVHDKEAAGERATVQIAPDSRNAGILVVIEHAVEVVERGVECRTVTIHFRVARVRQLAHADHGNTTAELHVGQMARQVHHHA